MVTTKQKDVDMHVKEEQKEALHAFIESLPQPNASDAKLREGVRKACAYMAHAKAGKEKREVEHEDFRQANRKLYARFRSMHGIDVIQMTLNRRNAAMVRKGRYIEKHIPYIQVVEELFLLQELYIIALQLLLEHP